MDEYFKDLEVTMIKTNFNDETLNAEMDRFKEI